MAAYDANKINSEFNELFDILYNSITSNQAPGLDAYEKSVFLTLAQYDIVESYFNPRKNKLHLGIDDSSDRRIDFSGLIKEGVIAQNDTAYTNYCDWKDDPSHSPNNKMIGATYSLNNWNVLRILNEWIWAYDMDKSEDGAVTTDLINKILKKFTVIPLSQEEYDRIMSKPFRYPPKGTAWRIGTNPVTILRPLPRYAIKLYHVRYVKRPNPIILEDLLDGLTIEGESTARACELDPSIFPDIIRRACELAKASYLGDLNSQIALGVNSLTELGIIPLK